MANLESKYVGLNLKNPLIVASSGLTKNISGVKKAYNAGAGAIVLKSVFEEQILQDSLSMSQYSHTEEYEYLINYGENEYITLIKQAKDQCDIPIIASINCHTMSGWLKFAKQVEEAGADALEINIMQIPTWKYAEKHPFEESYYENMPIKPHFPESGAKKSEEIENENYEIVESIKKEISIPIILKTASEFTSLQSYLTEMSRRGADAFATFNGPIMIDFDIEKKKLVYKKRLSSDLDMHETLRWISLLNRNTKCDLSASRGINSFETCIKMIMAGASTVQLCSAIYRDGFDVITDYIKRMDNWLDKNNINSIESLRGTIGNYVDVEHFSRLHYMKASMGGEWIHEDNIT